jgi:hypothetical protein
MEFDEIWYFVIFRKYIGKIQVLFKSDKNSGTLHKNLFMFMEVSNWILLRYKFQKKIKNKTFFCYMNFFQTFDSYVIMWYNMYSKTGQMKM